MFEEIKPIELFIPISEKEKHDFELYDAIATAIHSCGFSGGDVTMMTIETLKKLGRYDLIPPCER